MEKIRVVYLAIFFEVLLTVYLNGTTIDPAAKDVI